MLCPKCNLDISAWETEKREAFEKRFGLQLKPHRTRAKIGGIARGIFLMLLFCLFFWSDSLNPLETLASLRAVSIIGITNHMILKGSALLLVSFITVGALGVFNPTTNEEKLLWLTFDQDMRSLTKDAQ